MEKEGVPSTMNKEKRSNPSSNNVENNTRNRNTSNQRAVRGRIAFTIVATFALLCLAVLFIPDAKSLDHLIPFVAPAVMVVLNYYFGRDQHNK